MVKKILRIFNYELGGLHKAALVLAFSSVISAFLGIFRDRLLASKFGASESLDIYYAAFKIPDLLYIALLSLVSVTVLIPIFLDKNYKSQKEAGRFLNGILTSFLLAVAALSVAAFFATPYFVGLVAPGFGDEASAKLILVTKVLLLSPLFLGLSNLLSSVVQSYNKFFIYALSPVFYNAGIIFGIVFFSEKYGLVGVAMGVAFGAFLHLAVQLPTVFKLGFIPMASLKINLKETLMVAKMSLPRTFGLGLNQIALIFITAFASFLGAGSIAVFNLSFNLQSVPLAVIGVSYSVAAFPTLAKYFVRNQKEEFNAHVVAAARQILFWSAPVSALVIVLRAQIVRVILGAGEFGWRDTRLTAAALAIFAVSVTAQAGIILFTRAFYAAGKTWKPVVINLVSTVFIIIASFFSLKFFGAFASHEAVIKEALRVGDVASSGVLALPAVFSMGMILNVFLLLIIFQKEFGSICQLLAKTFFQVVFSSFALATVSYLSLNIFDDIFDINTFIGIFSQGALAAAFGFAAWYLVLKFMKSNELEEIAKSLRQKFWKTNVIAPEPDRID
ncbi:TPA: hypothetical protein DEW47_02320 [Patescibacteria group bacterium]|nr:MAG: Integral membrane protein MviN [Parcubacteria group bacterium GW2011_GWF2_40_10]KKR47688.1 MAG: Integral membrane protein MviN [Parcubacteria group bacterium GW2011_GWA2_40_143]KKR60058.1 MAG: Integral membrane protein MviN [Parcubacteria group bacterium GW2011_GWC2_40_31]KKR75355.1 MAG: Integral membrane protein MviN [Parcubacteria group bacterium GW2011_GWE2_40_8]KKR82445.1 MAG: Integral membrane protein MviN [Parcubacteria group bacterium GW2011_GWD2_40_9]HBB56884.1 hypothetical pro